MVLALPFFVAAAGMLFPRRVAGVAKVVGLVGLGLENQLHVRNAKSGRNPILHGSQPKVIKRVRGMLGVDETVIFEMTEEDLYDPAQKFLCRVWMLTDGQSSLLRDLMKKDTLSFPSSIPSQRLTEVLERYHMTEEDQKLVRGFTNRSGVNIQLLMAVTSNMSEQDQQLVRGFAFQQLLSINDFNISESWMSNLFLRSVRQSGDQEEFRRARELISKARAELKTRQKKEGA